MKLNNKGLSIIEFIVVFVILMILVFGMMGIVVSLKDQNASIKMEKELLEFKTGLTKIINEDLIEKGYKNYITTSNTITFGDDTTTILKIDNDNKTIFYGGIIYDIPQKDFIEMDTPSVTVDGNYFKISIPYHELGANEKKDYGINIVYPIGL